jgi:N-acetyl-gamma-glutamylphosphate reductase
MAFSEFRAIFLNFSSGRSGQGLGQAELAGLRVEQEQVVAGPGHVIGATLALVKPLEAQAEMENKANDS